MSVVLEDEELDVDEAEEEEQVIGQVVAVGFYVKVFLPWAAGTSVKMRFSQNIRLWLVKIHINSLESETC
jgi:hypothetical protein